MRGNDPKVVETVSALAFSKVPHPTSPIAQLTKLDGVGPATASAALAALAPETYPFFDDLVAKMFPKLGPVAWTLSYYARYADALRSMAEELGADGAYFRVHHFARQLASPFPLLAAVGARTSRIEIGTGVIDMRYENPLYMAEDAGAADLVRKLMFLQKIEQEIVNRERFSRLLSPNVAEQVLSGKLEVKKRVPKEELMKQLPPRYDFPKNKL